MKKNERQADINVTLKKLFKRWLETTVSFHKLPKQKQDILSQLLYYHHIYQRDITNEKIVWKMVFDYDTKLKIKEYLSIDDQTLQNNLTILRKKGVIVNNTITPFFIPNLEKNSNNFKVIFNFNIINDKSG